MSIFWQWLFNILDSLLFWRILPPNERGIRTFCGKHPIELGPGLHWVFPVLGDIMVTDITEQVVDVRSQSLTTRDGESVAIGISVAYEVLNAYKALYRVEDRDNSLVNETLRIVGEFVRTHDYGNLLEDTLADWVIRELRKIATDRWGLKVLRVGLSDCSKHRALRIMGVGSGERPLA